ncbi:MAG: Flp pilus assembly complex ATPase component TadA, partial [Proteobacteria bacterium]|nr:Flp pilus assembly complex ATPase component TadA [Pseudomonadota bacterium]
MFDIIVKTKAGKKVKGLRCPTNECGIGKAGGNLIQLRGWKVAPNHAEFHRTPDGLFIEDMSNGNTLVNGEPVERYGPLSSSDVISIGGFHISAGIDESVEGNYVEDVDDVKTMIGVQHHPEIEEDETLFKKERFMWRNRLHEELLHMMDLRRTDIGAMNEDQLRHHIQTMIAESIKDMEGKLPAEVDKDELAEEVLNEAVGLGPLEELLANDDISEVMVNRHDEIYIEKGGNLTKSNVVFSSDDAVMSAIERIVAPLGRRIDESSPMVDARLKDGSRVNAIIPPLAIRG